MKASLIWIIVGMVLYVGSYAALRCSAMRWSAGRHGIYGKGIVTRVYFGQGDNFATRVACVAYFPLHKSEHALRLWAKQELAYE